MILNSLSRENESNSLVKDTLKLGKCLDLLLLTNDIELSSEQLKSLNTIDVSLRNEEIINSIDNKRKDDDQQEQQQKDQQNEDSNNKYIVTSLIMNSLSRSFMDVHRQLFKQFDVKLMVANQLLIKDQSTTSATQQKFIRYHISPPSSYFSITRLFTYLISHHQSILFSYLFSLVSDIILFNQEQLLTSTSKETTNSTTDNDITLKKKKLLDHLIMYNHLIISLKSISFNNHNDNNNNECFITSSLPSLISLMDIQLPTRLAVECSDLNLNLILLFLQQQENEDFINNDITNQIIDIINQQLSILLKWHQSKPLMCFALKLIQTFNKQLLISSKEELYRFKIWYQGIIPLLYYQFNSVTLKEKLLRQNIDILYKLSTESNNNNNIENNEIDNNNHQIDLDIIDKSCISIFILISGLNETRQNQVIQSNLNELIDITSFLIQFPEINIQYYCTKLLELAFSFKLNIGNADDDISLSNDLVTTMMMNIDGENDQIIPKPILHFIATTVTKNRDRLLPKVLDQMESLEITTGDSGVGDSQTKQFNNYIQLILELVEINPNIFIESSNSSNINSRLCKLLLNHQQTATLNLFRFIDYNISLPLTIEYISNDLSETTVGSSFYHDVFLSILEYSNYNSFNLFLDILLNRKLEIKDNNSNSNNNNLLVSPNNLDIYIKDNDKRIIVLELKIIEKLINVLPHKLKTIDKNSHWNDIVNCILVKWWSFPKDVIISKIYQKIISIIPESIIIGTILYEISNRMQNQLSLLNNNIKYDEELVFLLLSPLLLLKITLKELNSRLINNNNNNNSNNSSSKININEQRIVFMDQLYQMCLIRVISRNESMIVETKRVASECISYIPANYWLNSVANILEKMVKSDDISVDISFSKQLLFSLCNGFLVQPNNIISTSNNNNNQDINIISKLMNIISFILNSKINLDIELKKLQMGAADLLAFMIKTALDTTITTATQQTSITVESIRLHKLNFNQIADLNNNGNLMLMTLFKYLYNNNSESSLQFKLMLLHSLMTLSKIIEDKNAIYKYKQLIFTPLIRLYFLEQQQQQLQLQKQQLNYEVQIGTVQIIYSIIMKLDSKDQLVPHDEDLFEIILESVKQQKQSDKLCLAGLRLLGTLMKSAPELLFSSADHLLEINKILLNISKLPEQPNQLQQQPNHLLQQESSSALAKQLLNIFKMKM